MGGALFFSLSFAELSEFRLRKLGDRMNSLSVFERFTNPPLPLLFSPIDTGRLDSGGLKSVSVVEDGENRLSIKSPSSLTAAFFSGPSISVSSAELSLVEKLLIVFSSPSLVLPP